MVALAVDAVLVVAVVQEVELIHSVVHHTEAVGLVGRIDQVVAEDPQNLLEEVPFFRGRDKHGLGLLVVLDSLADSYDPAKGLCGLIDCKLMEKQNHCFQRPLQLLFLLIPIYLSKRNDKQNQKEVRKKEKPSERLAQLQ